MSKFSKKKIFYLLFSIIVLLIAGFYYAFQNNFFDKTDDFVIKYDNQKYNVIVEKPQEHKDKYPLIIFNHGGGYETLEPFDLRGTAKRLSEEGFLVWIPERSLWLPEVVLGRLSEAKGVSKTILDIALQHSDVDKNNINVMGFCLGSWAILEENIYSENIKSMSLIAFGAPFDHTVIYDRLFKFIEEIDYEKISTKVLIMVSQGDTRLNIEAGEALRSNMVDAKKKVSVVQYEEGDHLSMTGVKRYLEDVIKFVKGEKVNSAGYIQLDKDLLEKRDSLIKKGYW